MMIDPSQPEYDLTCALAGAGVSHVRHSEIAGSGSGLSFPKIERKGRFRRPYLFVWDTF
jgi:hypothetical protein